MKNKVTLILIFTAFIALCFSCNRSNEQIVVINDTEDTIATKAPQTLTYDFRKDAIIALYMLGCNDRLEMGLPKDHTEDYWNFLGKVDSLAEAPDYFERIESNLAKDRMVNTYKIAFNVGFSLKGYSFSQQIAIWISLSWAPPTKYRKHIIY